MTSSQGIQTNMSPWKMSPGRETDMVHMLSHLSGHLGTVHILRCPDM